MCCYINKKSEILVNRLRKIKTCINSREHELTPVFVLLFFNVPVSFNAKTAITDMNVTAMGSVYQHFGITHLLCRKIVALDRVISTALGKWHTRLYLSRATHMDFNLMTTIECIYYRCPKGG